MQVCVNQWAFVSLTLVLGISGCAVTPDECDPTRDTGFTDKVKCEAFSDGYEQNVRQAELTLEEKQAYQEALQETYVAISAESAEVRDEISAQSAEYAALNSAVQNLLALAEQHSAENQALQREIQALQEKLDQVNSEQDSVLAKKQQLQELQQQVTALEAALGL